MISKKALSMIIASLMLAAGCGGNCLAQTLREYAARADILVGTAVNPALFREDAYAATLAREFNMLEPENVMKWGALRPTQSAFNFAPGDEVVRFAQAHRMKVRGHCLVWGKYNPAWLMQGHFTPLQLAALLHEHITKVMRHYAGQVFAWDMVNEAFDARGG